MMPLGTYNLGWAKDGFADVVEKVTVGKAMVSIKMKAKPPVGKSALIAMDILDLCGDWQFTMSPDWVTMWKLKPDMTFSAADGRVRRGTWRLNAGRLIAVFADGGTVDIAPDGDGFSGGRFQLRRIK
jgi:hypothetical protein